MFGKRVKSGRVLQLRASDVCEATRASWKLFLQATDPRGHVRDAMQQFSGDGVPLEAWCDSQHLDRHAPQRTSASCH